MTNFDKWQSLCDGLCSPQNMVDAGWRFIIAAALQRRVWYGEAHMPCYANEYMILYGPPGVGKSLILDMVEDILKHHKKKDFSYVKKELGTQEATLAASIDQVNTQMAADGTIKMRKGGEVNEPCLFPYAPDATTYEALVESMGMSFRRMPITKIVDGKVMPDVYGHCSMYFKLDELGSLFRKKADAVVNYLLGLYGCPKEYEYKTKNSGEDRVLRGCLNLIAGTTPEFMEEVSNDKLIGNGFSARCKFICATKNRKNVARPKALTEEQLQYKQDLLVHIKELARLYGEAKVDKETIEFLDDWWNSCEDPKHPKHNRPNKSSKLDSYYPRKNIHLYKLILQEHFSESTELFIPLSTVKRCISILEKEEMTMHLALMVDGNNPLNKVTNKCYDYIVKHGKALEVDLSTEFWSSLPQGNRSMNEIIQHLIASEKIQLTPNDAGQQYYTPRL